MVEKVDEVLSTAMRALPDAKDSRDFMRITLARLIVFFSIALGWLVVLLGMLVLAAVHPA